MIRKRGFTLIELVVAMAIFIIIATAISIAVSRLYAIRTFYEQQLDLQQNFVYAMDRLSEDFRQAEYSGTDIFVSPPESNAMIDATESTPLSFYGPGGQVVSYYLKKTGDISAIYRKEGSSAAQPITEDMHQLVKLYFIRYGGKVVCMIVGEVKYFGMTNQISFTSVVYARNYPQVTDQEETP